MKFNQVTVANSAIKLLGPVAGYMTEMSCLGLVQGSLGAVKSPAGEGLALDLLQIWPQGNVHRIRLKF